MAWILAITLVAVFIIAAIIKIFGAEFPFMLWHAVKKSATPTNLISAPPMVKSQGVGS